MIGSRRAVFAGQGDLSSFFFRFFVPVLLLGVSEPSSLAGRGMEDRDDAVETA